MRVAIVVLILVLLAVPIMAQVVAPPTDVDNAVLQKIDQDGKVTRKYFSDELTRQNDAFLKEVDKRTAYYEKEFFDTLNNLIFKLSMFWGAVIFFVFGLSNMLRMTLESKRFKRMKQTLKDELKEELSQAYAPKGAPKSRPVIDTTDLDVMMHARPLVRDKPKRKSWLFGTRKPSDIEILKEQNALLMKKVEEMIAVQKPIEPTQPPTPKVEVF